MNKPLIIDYYTDILCVWAWIAQRRIDELNTQFGGKVELQHHYIDVFGSVAKKMDLQWRDRGGYSGFAKHVQKSADQFEHVPVNSKIWAEVRPTTSANAHLIIKAVEISYGKEKSALTALMLRDHFFNHAEDISNLDVLYSLLKNHDLDHDVINSSIRNGAAMAALMADYQKAKQQNIKGSPSFVMDGGRQILYGNVGYRVIYTNVQELLKHPEDEASWC